MPTQYEIGRAGEIIVADWLQRKNYTTDIDTRGAGSTDIEARGAAQKGLLVQVKSAVLPNEPDFLSDDEAENIKARARRLGFEAWEAKVQLDAQLNLQGEIGWRRLN